MLQSKCGTIAGTAATAFTAMLDVGNTINGTTGQKIKVKSGFITLTGETGSSKAENTVSLVAYSGTTAITLDTTAAAADAVVNDSFTTEIALAKGSTYVNKIGFSIPAKTGANAVSLNYIINYE